MNTQRESCIRRVSITSPSEVGKFTLAGSLRTHTSIGLRRMKTWLSVEREGLRSQCSCGRGGSGTGISWRRERGRKGASREVEPSAGFGGILDLICLRLEPLLGGRLTCRYGPTVSNLSCAFDTEFGSCLPLLGTRPEGQHCEK